jgi:hypothetical protein
MAKEPDAFFGCVGSFFVIVIKKLTERRYGG